MKSRIDYFKDKNFLISFFSGLIFLSASLFIQFLTSQYATRLASQPVTDIILSNTRVYDVDGIFIFGPVFLVLLILYLCIVHVRYTPFIFKSLATFTLIRAIFVSLTHISSYPVHMEISPAFFQHSLFNGIFTGDGLFFSGHTGTPFLFALMFWDNVVLRTVFLFFSILFGVVVLLGHVHYSIDVFSAFFITYSIFNICKFAFKSDWKMFSN